MTRLRWRLALAVLVSVPTACGGPAPKIDTSGMEPPVRRLIETRRAALNASPEARTWGELGDALLAHGLDREAESCYARAADSDVDPFEWRYLQALAASSDAGRADRSLALYRQALSRRPGVALVELRSGLLLQSLGRFDEAAAAFERAQAWDPSMQRAQRGLGQVLLESGRVGAAIVALERAVATNAADAAGWSALAQAYATAGRDAESRAAADRVARGRELAGFQDAIRQRHVVESGVSSARRFERTLYALARDDLPEARQQAQAILEQRDDQADAAYLLGLIESRSGNTVEAGRQLQRALELDPEHGRSLTELATLAEQAGRFDAARSWIERARQVTPRDPSIVRALIRNRYRANDVDGVVRALEKLIELEPDVVTTHIDLADLYMHREQWADAELRYREAIRLAPGSDEARYAAERLEVIRISRP